MRKNEGLEDMYLVETRSVNSDHERISWQCQEKRQREDFFRNVGRKLRKIRLRFPSVILSCNSNHSSFEKRPGKTYGVKRLTNVVNVLTCDSENIYATRWNFVTCVFFAFKITWTSQIKILPQRKHRYVGFISDYDRLSL